MRDLVSTSTKEIVVEVVPGNGDCLFAAISHQWCHMDVSSNLFVEMVANLRSDVVVYLIRRLEHCPEL